MKKIDHKIIKLGLVAVVIGAMIVGVLATTGTPVASQEEEPSAWSVRCNETEEGVADVNKCEMFQRLVVQETGQRVAEFAIGFPEDRDTARGVLILPLGILLPEGAQMRIDDGQAFKFKFRYCTDGGCFAFLNMTEALLTAMRNGDKAALDFKALDGKDVSLTISLAGFSDSIEKIS